MSQLFLNDNDLSAGNLAISPDEVAVVIVNWNSGGWLRKTLEGLDCQSIVGFRLIIVDNASTDNSLEDATKLWPAAQVYAMEKNMGFAAANNLAIRGVDCKWIALLNPDAIPEPGWLEHLLLAAQAHQNFSSFGSLQLSARSSKMLDGWGDAYHSCGLAWRHGYRMPAGSAPSVPTEIFSPCAAAALYRREVFLGVGGFDERFFCYMEDVDLGFRMRLAGHRALYVPDAVVHHEGAATTGVGSSFSIYHGHRNMVWAFTKNMPANMLWRSLPLHIAVNALTIIAYILKGRGRVVVKAKWDAMRGLPSILVTRRIIQRQKAATDDQLSQAMAHGLWMILRKSFRSFFDARNIVS
jgi:GT2 family glycosyltransferase